MNDWSNPDSPLWDKVDRVARRIVNSFLIIAVLYIAFQLIIRFF